MMKLFKQTQGFTLVELAVVMVIVGLLLTAFLTPLTTQFEQKRVSEARQDLAEIKQALLGFASVNLRLPCPDTDADGIENCVGAANSNVSTGGNVPWITLGTRPTDPWDRRYQYRVNTQFSLAPITLNSSANGAESRICSSNACAAPLEASGVPAVVYSSGANGAIQPPVGVDELQNTAVAGASFDGTFVNHAFATAGAPNGQFDDVMDWISTNVLMGQLVAAGQLP